MANVVTDIVGIDTPIPAQSKSSTSVLLTQIPIRMEWCREESSAKNVGRDAKMISFGPETLGALGFD
jgi:hypothetical protein